MGDTYEKVGIGIDLGTTYSCVGVWRDEQVEILANDMGDRTTPSYVAFTEDERIVGIGAKSQAARNPSNTVFDAKRLIGRAFSDPLVQEDMKLWPFKVVDAGEDKPSIQVEFKGEEKVFTPEEISAMILMKMRDTASDFLGHPVHDAVITVPAYFNDGQRNATKAAGEIAGLNVLRIINEPTAAAIAYGIDNQEEEEKLILVFDLGGGTFDVSVLAISDGVFEVRATAGDTHLGGEDFDTTLMNHVLKEFKKKHRNAPDPMKNNKSVRRLRTACERAKRTLSNATSATVEVDSLIDGIDFQCVISRARFEDMCGHFFKACMEPVNSVLSDLKIPKSRIDEVVLVGGSTRIPKVQQLIKEAFHGKEANKTINPDEAVAYGAAVQAAILMGDTSEATENILLIDVAPLSIGVETAGGMMSTLIKRNSTIPVEGKKLYSTNSDNQTSVEVIVYEGERPKVKDNNMLGQFELEGIPPAAAGVPRIEVSLKLDANGMLNVTSTEKATNKTLTGTITNTGRLSAEQIAKMVTDAEKYKDQDSHEMKKDLARRELEMTCSEMREAINDPKLRINRADWEEIDRSLNWVISYIAGNADAKTKELIEQKRKLEDIVDPILMKLYKGHGLAAKNCGIAEQRKRKISQMITHNQNEAKKIKNKA